MMEIEYEPTDEWYSAAVSMTLGNDLKLYVMIDSDEEEKTARRVLEKIREAIKDVDFDLPIVQLGRLNIPRILQVAKKHYIDVPDIIDPQSMWKTHPHFYILYNHEESIHLEKIAEVISVMNKDKVCQLTSTHLKNLIEEN